MQNVILVLGISSSFCRFVLYSCILYLSVPTYILLYSVALPSVRLRWHFNNITIKTIRSYVISKDHFFLLGSDSKLLCSTTVLPQYSIVFHWNLQERHTFLTRSNLFVLHFTGSHILWINWFLCCVKICNKLIRLHCEREHTIYNAIA